MLTLSNELVGPRSIKGFHHFSIKGLFKLLFHMNHIHEHLPEQRIWPCSPRAEVYQTTAALLWYVFLHRCRQLGAASRHLYKKIRHLCNLETRYKIIQLFYVFFLLKKPQNKTNKEFIHFSILFEFCFLSVALSTKPIHSYWRGKYLKEIYTFIRKKVSL